MCFGKMISATVSQYTTLSNGKKKYYTDQDALPEYNSSKILSPDKVSYYTLYVNGVPQPPVNYSVAEGSLILRVTNPPPKNAPIVLEFITLYDDNCVIEAKADYYVAKSSPDQEDYDDSDALREFSTGGIPDSSGTSFQRLFINGVLQPPSVYSIEKGHLRLKVNNTAPQGAYIILHSIRIFVKYYRQEISDLIESIALSQAGLAHILNAMGEELQENLTGNFSAGTRLQLSQSVKKVITAIQILEQTQFHTLERLKRYEG